MQIRPHEDQRLVLLLGDETGRLLRRPIVERLEEADVPFRPAVIGIDLPFDGFGPVAEEMGELLQKFRPHVAHVSVGRTDLQRTIESDGNSYPARGLVDICRDLNHLVDAAKLSADTDLVIATAPPVRDELQDLVRDDDINRLNVVIREVGQRRDVLIDRWDRAIDLSATEPAHLEPNGHRLTEAGLQRVADSATKAIIDALLRAENPWNQLARSGRSSPLEGIPRPRHPELP
ncbi:MAG: hypothetical protein OSA40_07690 [Phycisphaerales bacterium]|nr:hypothetical protein [Phycisphaerales bacterium]